MGFYLNKVKMQIIGYCLLALIAASCYGGVATAVNIEGIIRMPPGLDDELSSVRVVLNDGEYSGFVKADGRFTIYNVPTKSSHVATVLTPKYVFESMRVEITGKGNIRARKLSLTRPSVVEILEYPLLFRPMAVPKYFQKREEFSVLDMLKNPMVLMMLVPLIIVGVLPKMMNSQDPEVRKEMEEQMKMFSPNQNQLPDMSDVLSNWFGSGAPPKKKSGASTPAVAASSRNRRR